MKESDIRNRENHNKYLELVKADSRVFFKQDEFVKIDCPACAGKNYSFEFEKTGFDYVMCRDCSTLFSNPRPVFESIRKFYSKSPSTSFWVNDFFKPVAEARREKIFRPRAEYIQKVLDEGGKKIVGDIGAGFGIFLEELKKIMPDNGYIAIEPSEEMAAICERKKLDVRCMPLEEMDETKDKFDLLSAFELAEHLFDPSAFLKKAHSLLKPGGYFFMTTLNGRGFDISLLWDRSKSILPPCHLNFFNPESMRILLKAVGFEITEIATPGKLDWDIVEGMIKDENVQVDRFWKRLANEGSDKCKKDLQNWISKNNLSSHMSALARKP